MNDMNGKAARQQRDAKSVQGLAELLRGVCATPAGHVSDASLVQALKSQGALAKFAKDDSQIHGMSLNHQKAIADKTLGGYDVLDGLRRAAVEALDNERSRERRSRAITKARLRSRVKELEVERLILLEELMLLQRVFDLRCLQARQYAAKADKATQTRCAKEQQEIDVELSLRRRPGPMSNVTSIRDARRHGHA